MIWKNGIKVGQKESRFPIIQGGMAIRISTGLLAGTVAKEGGIGVIGASGMRFDELADEIRKAREISGEAGIIGINIMYAAREFWGVVRKRVDVMWLSVLVGVSMNKL